MGIIFKVHFKSIIVRIIIVKTLRMITGPFKIRTNMQMCSKIENMRIQQ